MKTPAQAQNWMKEAFSGLPVINGVESEIYYLQSQTRSVAWADGKPSLNEAALNEGLCLRTLEEGRQGLLTTRALDRSKIAVLAKQAHEMAKAMPADTNRRFAPRPKESPEILPLDAGCFSRPLQEIHQTLSQLETSVLKVDPRIKKVIKFHWSEKRFLKCLMQSQGVPLVDAGTITGFAAEILAEQPGQTEVAWDYQSSRFSKEINVGELALSVARNAAAALGGKPIPSGKYAVVVHPRVGAQLLDLMAKALSAEAVQRGRSFLRDKRMQTVASPLVNISDDPSLPNGVASGSFDDEGVANNKLDVVSNGVLLSYFYDLRSAAVEHRPSNGRGMKEGLSSVPRASSTNFFMKPGVTPVEEMFQSDHRVFLLREVMGLHMADPITGEFSLGASGSLYEKGKYLRPVRGVTIAGTVASMLKGVTAVAPDLSWLGSTGAPSFLLPSVTIAGI